MSKTSTLLKSLCVILSLGGVSSLRAELTKSIEVTESGTLETLLTDDEKSAVTDLVVTTADGIGLAAEDFAALNALPALKSLDLSGAKTGVGIPKQAFYQNRTIETFLFPTPLAGGLNLGENAFSESALKGVVRLPKEFNGYRNAKGRFSKCYGITGFELEPGGSFDISTENGIVYDANKSILALYPNGKSDEVLEVPAGVTTTFNNAIESNHFLKRIVFPEGFSAIARNTLIDLPALESVVIKEGMTSLVLSAFTNLTALKEVELPASLQTIEGTAFYNCTALERLLCLAEEVPALTGRNNFGGVPATCQVLVPAASLEKYIASAWNIANDATFAGFTAGQFVAYSESYSIRITGGEASVNGEPATTAQPGDVVTVTASVPDGMEFMSWESSVTLDDATAAVTTFVMPYADVTLTARCRNATAYYTITVVGGEARIGDAVVSQALESEVITVSATDREKTFRRWVAEGVTLADASAAETTFVMPAGDVFLTAEYIDLNATTKMIEIATSGTLESFFTADELAIVTDVYVTTVDGAYLTPADIAVLNGMPALKMLDLSRADVSGRVSPCDYSMPAKAFENNATIETIVLPESLNGIGGNAFYNTHLQGTFRIPAVTFDLNHIRGRFVKSLGITAFEVAEEAANLKSVDGVIYTKTGDILVAYPCAKTDERYEIAAGTKYTDNGICMAYNPYLKSVVLPASFENFNLAARTFEGGVLETFEVAEENPFFAACNGYLVDRRTEKLLFPKLLKNPAAELVIDGNVVSYVTSLFFNDNKSIEKVVMTEGVKFIEAGAFKGASNLAMVELPVSLDTIGNEAFQGCQKLERIISKNPAAPAFTLYTRNDVTTRGSAQFRDLPASTVVGVPSGSEANYIESYWIRDYKEDYDNNVQGFTAEQIVPYYTVSVEGGSCGEVLALAGDVLTVTADEAPEGSVFESWSATPTVEFADVLAAETTFVMPGSDVTVTAQFGIDTGIESEETVRLHVYPNPCYDYIVLAGDVKEYTIYSILGGVVAASPEYNGEAISVSHLPEGVYLVKAAGITVRFVKK